MLLKKKDSLENVQVIQGTLLFTLIVQPIFSILNNSKAISILGLLSVNPGVVLKLFWVVLLGYYSKTLYSSTT
jgi:hypothetical protein